MKIFIDIGHPHEVHFYKNFIKEMKSEGHEIIVTARDRGFLFDLLKKENIDFVSRGKGSGFLIGKLFLLVKNDIFIYKKARSFNPDILIGFGSFYISHVSWLLRKPGILFNDTEHSWLVQRLYVPFCKAIFTPVSYLKKHGKKHYMFRGFKEFAYLSKYVVDENSIKKELGLEKEEKYVVLRFISKNAFHDILYRGFNFEEKLRLVQSLKTKIKVFISSEGELPEELKKYELSTKPDKIHDVLAAASLFIGEGATMAAESALLGVPSIYNYMKFGYLKDLEEKGLLKYSKNVDKILKDADAILKDANIHAKQILKVEEYKKQCVNLTRFMKWIVTSYPDSLDTLKKNPDFQYEFKIDRN